MPDRWHANRSARRPERAGEAREAEDEPGQEGGRREDGKRVGSSQICGVQCIDTIQIKGRLR